MVAPSPYRTAIIDCVKSEMTNSEIVKKLKVSRVLVFRTAQRYRHLVTVTTPEAVKAVREKIRRTPERSMRKMSKEYEMNDSLPYAERSLPQSKKTLRMEKARKLLAGTKDGSHLTTLFTDEKIFTVEANKNGQNHRIIATDYQSACEKGKILNKTSHPASVMQDGAPAHRAKGTQEWCRANFPEFISAADWPASSPDLNPMDYAVWGYLTDKTALIKKWDEINDDYLRAVIDAYPKRLKAVINAKGGRF
ncbi:unnamed protein product [Caenorhabditis auriculariae]|uniref:Tc1-like transposase DDE domain-containing protein n=1 Tax=Caenorhabditis auriculariae TaxID=2777116 RepID=A0A8S1HW57_9PELO|nr:unnamed protein product [Caenorhabditis auriculariae]